MRKLIALICVISWSGFWAFGYLALSARIDEPQQMVTAGLLAFAGLLTGMFTYLRLSQQMA